MMNTIMLLHGAAMLTDKEYKKFEKGNTIWGDRSDPEEIARWSISEVDNAKAELERRRCIYHHRNHDCWDIDEYALQYCRCDEDGDFLDGSDYDLAPETEDVE